MNSIESGHPFIGLSGPMTIRFTVKRSGSGSGTIQVGVWDTPADSNGKNVSTNFQLVQSLSLSSMPTNSEEVTWEGTISSEIEEGNAIGLIAIDTSNGVDININNENATYSLWWKNTGTAEQDGTQSNQFVMTLGGVSVGTRDPPPPSRS